MRRYSLVIIAALLGYLGFGQISTNVQVTRPNPTVASLMNFNEVPVNIFTGIPDINVPLYSFPTHSKDISLNLSLNYHPSGASYLNKASDTGIGWNLFAGGVISRMVIDDPDGWTQSGLYTNDYNDVYSYSFLGHSGEFQILKDPTNNSFRLKNLSSTTMKIEYVMNPTTKLIDSFTIHDDKGYRFVFDKVEVTTSQFFTYPTGNNQNPSNSTPQAYLGYRSAYQLTKVYDNNEQLLIDLGYDTFSIGDPFVNMRIVNKLNTITVTGIGKAVFDYDHITSLDLNKYNDSFQLNGIQIKTINDALVKRYAFNYGGIGPTILYEAEPRRVMNSVQEFGSSGTENQQHTFYYSTEEYDGLDWCNENRLTVGGDGYLHPAHIRINLEPGLFVNSATEIPSLNKYGVLKEILLPTGGTIKYDFEPNTYNNNDPSRDFVKENPYNKSNTVYDYHEFDTSVSSTYTFTVTGTQTKELYFKFKHEPYFNANHTDPNAPLEPVYTITGPNGFSYDFKNGYYIDPAAYEDNYFSCLGKMLTLNPGTYTIHIHLLYADSNTTGNITISEKTVNSPLQQYFYDSGVRIKKIQYVNNNNDAELQLAKETNYDYSDFNDANKTSGRIYYYYGAQRNLPTTEYVGYHNVRIYDNGNNGFTKYTYYNYNDYAPPGTTDPFLIDQYFSYQKGLLQKKEVFSTTDKLSESNINYGFYTDANSNVWSAPVTTTTQNYFYPSGDILTTTEGFTYNMLNHQTDEHTVTNSVNETLKTKYYYHSGNAPLHYNRISELEKVETYRDSDILSSSHITYDNTSSGAANASYLPHTVEAAKGGNTPESRLEYQAYDEFGNPLQVRKDNGVIISYIWGYNKTVPIAKLENVSYATIPPATINNLQSLSNTPNNDYFLLAGLDALRTSFPKAMITTYTYKPLVGITTVTDPKGDKMTYIYDNFNRLKEVRDKNGKILSENAYFTHTVFKNYVKTTTYKEETGSSIANPTPEQALQSMTYYDGLGRVMQKIAHQQSASGKDIYTHIEYDATGRKTKDFLSFPHDKEKMDYIPGPVLKNYTIAYYQTQYNDTIPFSEKQLESSPLARLLKQAAPGDDWKMGSGHEVKYRYSTNVEKEVIYFRVGDDGSLMNKGYYDPNTLYRTIVKNEDDNATEEFKDTEGHILLKRTYNNADIYDTYYVYDKFSNLSFVIPPVVDVNSNISNSVLDNLCYQYKYDYRNRLIQKKLPGKQWEYIAYNSQDLPIASGPAKNPWGGTDWGWLITKYDIYGRVAYTGWVQNEANEDNRQSYENNVSTSNWNEEFNTSGTTTLDGLAISYSNAVYPNDIKLLTVNYYDGYTYTGAPTLPTEVQTQTVLTNVKGLATGSWVRVLDNPGNMSAEVSYILYDKKGRPIRTHKTNSLGGYTRVDSKLDFSGQVKETLTYHKRTSNSAGLTVDDSYSYTPQSRLDYHIQQINDGTKELISKNEYDELGQLINKEVGGQDTTNFKGYQKVDFGYNIRGWLKTINDVTNLNPANETNDLFAFKINYNTVENDVNQQVKALHNGNISETFWRSSTDNKLRKYGYKYDDLNRLTNSFYQKPDNANPITNMYNESMSYDKNGNIQTLQRYGDYDSDIYGPIQIDNLTYSYDPENKNLLQKVDDSSGSPKGFNDIGPGYNDYTYDANGNMTSDDNKGITEVSYNHLNLPVQINFASGDKIEYFYNAAGQKTSKKVTKAGVATVTDYLDGFQYTGEMLNFFPHAEGYVNVTHCDACQEQYQTRYNYVYQYKDHLGNIRLSYGYDQAAEALKVIEENHYYPYGLKHTRYNTGEKKYQPDEQNPELMKLKPIPAGEQSLYKYKYNGKEWQDELGLNMYAMDMRQYDPAIARWVVEDPIVHHSQSPYNGYDGNPVFWADPSGGKTEENQLSFGNHTDRWNLYIAPYERQGYGENDQASKTNYDNEDSVSEDSPIYQYLSKIGIKDPNSKAPIDIESVKKILTSPEILLLIGNANYKVGVDLIIDESLNSDKYYGLTYWDSNKKTMISALDNSAFNTWSRLALTITHEASHKIDYLSGSWVLPPDNPNKFQKTNRAKATYEISNYRSELKAWNQSLMLGDKVAPNQIDLYKRWMEVAKKKLEKALNEEY